MNRKRWLFGIVLAMLICGLSALPGSARLARAQDEPTPGPENKRKALLTFDVEIYKWWVIHWKNNRIACELFVEHPGFPSSVEILNSCGPSVHEDWYDTPPCAKAGTSDQDQCQGVYLHLVGRGRSQRQIEVDLPVPEVYISISGCHPEPPANRCSNIPGLLVEGFEPLPNENIIRLNGIINNEPFSCPGNRCIVPLKSTGERGAYAEFWADSSFGDSSQHFNALLRVVPWGDFMSPEGRSRDNSLYYVDVLSSQWKGEKPATCADTWLSMPDVGGPPSWLTTPDSIDGLKSEISYYFLAGMLIQNGAVDASMCPDGGLQKDLTATQCGLEAALPQVIEWQNRFDTEILKVAKDTGVPAQLIKSIFRRESQFWPGLYKNYREAGLGQLTSNGADTLLLWNPTFFNQFCPLVLSKETCSKSFDRLDAENQALLRGALVQKVNASCSDCPQGINMVQANFSIGVFAEGILANCEQVAQVLYNTTEQMPGQTTSYEDLWRFTLVNYNAGSGCLESAVQAAFTRQEPLDWPHIVENLEPACQRAISYIEDVSGVPALEPTPTPWFTLMPTPTPTLAPTLTPTSMGTPPPAE